MPLTVADLCDSRSTSCSLSDSEYYDDEYFAETRTSANETSIYHDHRAKSPHQSIENQVARSIGDSRFEERGRPIQKSSPEKSALCIFENCKSRSNSRTSHHTRITVTPQSSARKSLPPISSIFYTSAPCQRQGGGRKVASPTRLNLFKLPSPSTPSDFTHNKRINPVAEIKSRRVVSNHWDRLPASLPSLNIESSRASSQASQLEVPAAAVENRVIRNFCIYWIDHAIEKIHSHIGCVEQIVVARFSTPDLSLAFLSKIRKAVAEILRRTFETLESHSVYFLDDMSKIVVRDLMNALPDQWVRLSEISNCSEKIAASNLLEFLRTANRNLASIKHIFSSALGQKILLE